MVRSLHHDTGDHFAGAHRMLTAKDMGVSGANGEPKFPAFGAIATRELGPRRRGIPAYIGVPRRHQHRAGPGTSAGTCSAPSTNPFQTGGDPNAADFQVQNINLAAGLTLEKLEDRRSLVKHFDTTRRQLAGRADTKAMDKFSRQAYEFVSGPIARQGLRHPQGGPAAAYAYGRHLWGQSTLLARRLVEAGSTFVTMMYAGWDHHTDLKAGMQTFLPIVDSAVATLFSATWTSVACWRRRWWCCAASSAGRRR